MPNLLEDASTVKSIKLSILLCLRAIYFHTLQYETPCLFGKAVTISDLVCPHEA